MPQPGSDSTIVLMGAEGLAAGSIEGNAARLSRRARYDATMRSIRRLRRMGRLEPAAEHARFALLELGELDNQRAAELSDAEALQRWDLLRRP